MVDLANDEAEICVVGRTRFWTGTGLHSYAACELLARSFPVCILPTDDRSQERTAHVVLPNGRPIPVCQDVRAMRVFFFADIVWNGAHDLNHTLVPDHGLRIAYVACDSDELPSQWVQILNHRFDVALFTSRHLETIAVHSGVRIPVGTLPLALDIEAALARWHPRSSGQKVRFGSVAAWHERKGGLDLIDAFLEEFCADEPVELLLHSNLRIGRAYERITQRLASDGGDRVIISDQNLDMAAKEELLDSIDVLVSCSRGEGYSIPPREALARGRVLVLSEIGAHRDLLGVPGAFVIPPRGQAPARYPEIDHLVVGKQVTLDRRDIRSALRQAYQYITKNGSDQDVRLRKRRAAEFSFTALATSYAEVINPQIRLFRNDSQASSYPHIPRLDRDPGRLGAHARSLKARNWVVVPANDAGFFSVLNGFMSHVVWESTEDRCHMVLPDWDVARLMARTGSSRLESFCYGTPADGNIWCHLFEPICGLTVADMNDVALMDRKAVPRRGWNEHREPLLTYVHAYDLYRSPCFPNFRRRYHAAVTRHLRLLPHLAQEIDDFTAAFDGRFMIAAHVKHPSHVIEQPNGGLAATSAYIERIREEAAARGHTDSSPTWGVFLATDQDAVVQEFERCFGDRLHVFRDVRRTSIEDDAEYQKLPPAERARPGHQIQHLVAASPSQWSVSMAWEVVRDAIAMSRCGLLLHVVSNVATAVSYLNPDLEMTFCSPRAEARPPVTAGR